MIESHDLGVVPYREAFDLQERLREERILGKIPDQLLLLEHPPVFTLGKREDPDDFVMTPDVIRSQGIDIIKTNRGGRVTYHGPGQLVGYFICSIASLGLGVKEFVWWIEEILRLSIADFGIGSSRDKDHPGIWVDRKKIAAVGLNFSRGVSMHGFALNVSPNMAHFAYIVPCGIRGRGVTSIELETKTPIEMSEVKEAVMRHAAMQRQTDH